MFSTTKIVCVVVLLVSTVVADIDIGCDTISYYYRELGCTPIGPVGNATGCPRAYKCTDNMYPDVSKCYYRGVAYEKNTEIPREVIPSPCSRPCRCLVSEDNPRLSLLCPMGECFDEFITEKICMRAYDSLDRCCWSRTICDDDAIEALATCEYQGNSYKVGHIFRDIHRHKLCLCTSKWDGNVDNPANCRDYNCDVELYHQTEIRQKCAPIFSEGVKGGACPFTYQCPTESMKVTRLNKPVEVTEKCIFGNETLSVGDEVTVTENCVTCSCRVPPTVFCVKANNCANN